MTFEDVRVESAWTTTFAASEPFSYFAAMSAVPRDMFENFRSAGWLKICGSVAVMSLFAEASFFAAVS